MLNFITFWKNNQNALWRPWQFMWHKWQETFKSYHSLTNPNIQTKNYISISEHGCKLLSTDFKGLSLFFCWPTEKRFSSSHTSKNNWYLPITAIPCWTTKNWKFSSCNIYWTLYIIIKLTVLSFQKGIKKALMFKKYVRECQYFFQHIRELLWPVTCRCLALNFDVYKA